MIVFEFILFSDSSEFFPVPYSFSSGSRVPRIPLRSLCVLLGVLPLRRGGRLRTPPACRVIWIFRWKAKVESTGRPGTCLQLFGISKFLCGPFVNLWCQKNPLHRAWSIWHEVFHPVRSVRWENLNFNIRTGKNESRRHRPGRDDVRLHQLMTSCASSDDVMRFNWWWRHDTTLIWGWRHAYIHV